MLRTTLPLVVCGACGFSGPALTVVPPPDAPAPDALVLGGCDAVEVAASADHTCARAADGAVYCWGQDQHGELGVVPREQLCTATTPDGYCSPAPRKLALPAADSLGLGAFHSCATAAGTTYCWGLNGLGEYGDGTLVDHAPLGPVAQRSGATAIQGGIFHTCSLAQGHVLCSGKNDFGEVGNATMSQVVSATDVAQGMRSLGIGPFTSCALDGQGALSCWGRNDFKQIDQTQQNKLTPTKVAGLPAATQVAAGVYHVCVVQADHQASCWGSNSLGQLGNGAMDAAPQPPVVVQVASVVEIAAGNYHTCARDMTGAVWCFGENYGAMPAKVALPSPALALTAGDEHDCAITSDHRVWCWGASNYGQLGAGTASATRSTMPQLAKLCP